MRINERNVALQDINEHSAIAVEGVHQISNKADLYSKAGLDFEVESVNLGEATGNDNFTDCVIKRLVMYIQLLVVSIHLSKTMNLSMHLMRFVRCMEQIIKLQV